MVLGTSTSFASAPRAKKPCAVLEKIRSKVQQIEAASTFEGSDWKKAGKVVRKGAKQLPGDVGAAATNVSKIYKAVSKADNRVDAMAVYAEQVQKYEADVATVSAYAAENCADSSSGSSSSGSSGGAGTLTLGDETIALGSARCYLQSQTAAGQEILWNGQASGTNAAGEDVRIDVSRYDESSQFAGDDVSIDIGELGNTASWTGRYDIGTVDLSGKTISASGIEMKNEQFESAQVSFEINC